MGRVKFKFFILLMWHQDHLVPGVTFDPVEQHEEEVEETNLNDAWRAIYKKVFSKIGSNAKRLKEMEIRYCGFSDEVKPWEKNDSKTQSDQKTPGSPAWWQKLLGVKHQ